MSEVTNIGFTQEEIRLLAPMATSAFQALLEAAKEVNKGWIVFDGYVLSESQLEIVKKEIALIDSVIEKLLNACESKETKDELTSLRSELALFIDSFKEEKVVEMIEITIREGGN